MKLLALVLVVLVGYNMGAPVVKPLVKAIQKIEAATKMGK